MSGLHFMVSHMHRHVLEMTVGASLMLGEEVL